MAYRLMYDSDQPDILLKLAREGATTLFATYADLVTAELVSEFEAAGASLRVIDRGLGDPHALATIGDFEPRCLNRAAAGKWWDEHAHRGPLTVYADRTDMPVVLRALGPHRPAWRWWATLDGTLTIPGNPRAAVQFASADMTGIHADTSIVYHPGW